MAPVNDNFTEFVSNSNRRRLYERESLALGASELIARLMVEKNVSRTKLAEMVGTSKSHITNLLSGSRNMTVHTLADLTFALGHKVEITSSPLTEVMCWIDVDMPSDQTGREFYQFSYRDEHGTPPPPEGGAVEQWAFAS